MKYSCINYLRYFAAAFLLMLFQNLNAQESSEQEVSQSTQESIQNSKHSIHLEIGGRTFLMASINYEYGLNQRFSLGGGVGVINIQRGDILRSNNGASETGKYFDTSTTQMIYGNYFIGKNKHKLFFTAGLTNFLFTYRNKYPSETVSSGEAQLEWNAGIGYHFSAKKAYFRLTGYGISMPEPSDWFPKYMPWLGITAGWKLK